MASRNSDHKDRTLLRGYTPSFRGTYTRGPEEDVGNTNAIGAHAEAIKALVKPKDDKSPSSQRVAAASSLDLPTSFIPSLGNMLMPALSSRVAGSASQSPRARLKPRPRWLELWFQLPKVPRAP